MSGRTDQREGKAGAGPTVSEAGREMLADLMTEGLGDHILLLRLYQACNPRSCSGRSHALWLHCHSSRQLRNMRLRLAL